MLNNLFFNLAASVTETTTTAGAPEIQFNPMGFVEQLPAMGFGMLGIFIVIGIIVGATYLLNFIFKPRSKKIKK